MLTPNDIPAPRHMRPAPVARLPHDPAPAVSVMLEFHLIAPAESLDAHGAHLWEELIEA